MEHIRPHQIFAMVNPAERDFTAHLPRAIGGSVFALEACLLVALLRAVKPACVFEFGTYLGDTTRLFAQNLGEPGGTIYTLDLESLHGVEFEEEDAILAGRSVLAQRSFSGLPTEVEQLFCDSYLFNPAPYKGRIAFVFIDGNHALKYAEKDTANALRMTPDNEPSAVIWHDYGNPACPELTGYLNSLSKRLPLFHVEETMLVLHLQGIPLPEKRSFAWS